METALLQAAIQCYDDRKSRRSHPDGKFDRKGRWDPSPSEEQSCCRFVRSPSRAYPYSLMLHCRTAEHIAVLYGVDVKVLRRAVRQQSRPARRGGEDYFKAVAVVDGRYYSIYDGHTEYQLGVELRQRAAQDHGGGFYVYASAQAARDATVPTNSVLYQAPRVILRCRVSGSYCVYDRGKLAFSRLTPLVVVDD